MEKLYSQMTIAEKVEACKQSAITHMRITGSTRCTNTDGNIVAIATRHGVSAYVDGVYYEEA